MATGLHSTSVPRIFSIHAISSKADNNKEFAPYFDIFSNIESILLSVDSPLYFSGYANIGSEGI